jgi:hypothetical protein
MHKTYFDVNDVFKVGYVSGIIVMTVGLYSQMMTKVLGHPLMQYCCSSLDFMLMVMASHAVVRSLLVGIQIAVLSYSIGLPLLIALKSQILVSSTSLAMMTMMVMYTA